MTDAISRPGKIDAILLRDGLQVGVVVCIFEAYLDGIMIDIAYGKLSRNLFKSHGLELEIGHGPCRVLGKGLVYLYADLLSRFIGAIREVLPQDLFS